MPYFPSDYGQPSTYWCPKCRAYYEVPVVSISCCVLHSPGDCCHMGETKLEGKPAA